MDEEERDMYAAKISEELKTQLQPYIGNFCDAPTIERIRNNLDSYLRTKTIRGFSSTYQLVGQDKIVVNLVLNEPVKEIYITTIDDKAQ